MSKLIHISDSLACSQLKGAVCAIGVFDGVHVGHQHIIQAAAYEARQLNAPCIVLTFSIDPDELFRIGDVKKLMSNNERLQRLSDLDVDGVAVLEFTPALATLSAQDFLQRLAQCGLPASLHVGHDFRFGAKAAGTVELLQRWANEHGVRVHPHSLLEHEGAPITATRIRACLSQGDVRTAATLLGCPHSFTGTVLAGRQAGREMGVRTANLWCPPDMRVLKDGVYAASALVEGARYKAAVSVGVSPTFEDVAQANMEAHLLDFQGDLYNKRITLQFIERLRDMQQFNSTSDLVYAINKDIEAVRENL